MNIERHHDLTGFEVSSIVRAQELSQAVKRRADLETSPQAAIERLWRDMGPRKVNEIWREVLAVFPDPDATKAQTAKKAHDLTRSKAFCCICGGGFTVMHPHQVTCSEDCQRVQRRKSKRGSKSREVAK